MTAGAVAGVDLNCDLGEGSGWDALVMPWISSASIACGGHAGDAASVAAAAALARLHGVAAGAHPGYEDRAGFGRRAVDMPLTALADMVVRQIELFRQAAGEPAHVKPHGALYLRAAEDAAVAETLAHAVARAAPGTVLLVQAGSLAVEEGRKAGLRVLEEGFIDRSYEPDGRLTPRSVPGAVLTSVEAALSQAVDLAVKGGVRARDGRWIRVPAQTLCLHGDGKDPAGFARAVGARLAAEGVAVRRGRP
jgi:5-oxoprolinase (ATP-hydrolysing) subunit A